MAKKSSSKPKMLICTPELMYTLDDLLLNFSMGGLAPIPSSYARELVKEGTFDVSVAVPKWESSLRLLNNLNTKEIKKIEKVLPDNLYLIGHTSFNKAEVEGTNTRIYNDSRRFSAVDRALAFSNGIVNTVIPKVHPDIVWLHDWMVGLVGPVANAMGIKVVATGHNPAFTKYATFDEIVKGGIEIRNFDNYTPRDSLFWEGCYIDLLATEINSADDFTTVSKEYLNTLIGEYQKYKDWKFEDIPEDALFRKAPGVLKAIGQKYNSKHEDGRPRVHGYPNPLVNEKSDFLSHLEKDGLEATMRLKQQRSIQIRNETGLKEGGNLIIYSNRLIPMKDPNVAINNAVHLANVFDLRFLFLANGEDEIVNAVKREAFRSNGLVAAHSYNKKWEELAVRSDNVYDLMTPISEPCGNQNINHPFEGTLVIGHAIDGIKDTVHQLDWINSTGNGFPYNNNDVWDLDKAFSKMKQFAWLPDNERYIQLIRIANETQKTHSASSRTAQVLREIFIPLYEEKKREKN
jgi:glycogen synthase